MNTKHLSSALDLRSLDEEGAFEGYASVFDDTDHMRDKVAPGAFADTLAEHKRQGRLPPMLWQHDTSEPIGAWREMREDHRGLYVRGSLFIDDIPKARQAHKLMRENVVTGLSIGFRAVSSRRDEKSGVRILTKIDLLEVSMVTFPALDSARIASIKALIADGRLPEKRMLENLLRDAGFSRRQAKGLLAQGYAGLARRDAGQDLDLDGLSDAGAIDALSRLLQRLSV